MCCCGERFAEGAPHYKKNTRLRNRTSPPMWKSSQGGRQTSISKFVTTSPSTAVETAFRRLARAPIDGFPKGRDKLLEDGVIRDEDVKHSNAGKRLDRLLNETAGLLATGNDAIRSVKEGAAQLVAQASRADNRKEFLLQRAGAIFALKVASRTGFVRGRMR